MQGNLYTLGHQSVFASCQDARCEVGEKFARLAKLQHRRSAVKDPSPRDSDPQRWIQNSAKIIIRPHSWSNKSYDQSISTVSAMSTFLDNLRTDMIPTQMFLQAATFVDDGRSDPWCNGSCHVLQDTLFHGGKKKTQRPLLWISVLCPNSSRLETGDARCPLLHRLR